MAARKIDALVFDFDGIIVDTEGPAFRAWQELFIEHQQNLALNLWQAEIGTHGAFDPYAHLEQSIGRPVDRESVRNRTRARSAELIARCEVLPGVMEWIREAQSTGLRLAMASSSPTDWVTGFLDRFELRGIFEVLKCREDVEAVKPEPHLYTSAVHSLGVEPSRALAVEDSPNGIKSAKAAGLWCVAVPHDLTRNLPLDEADVVLSSLNEMTIAQVLHKLEA